MGMGDGFRTRGSHMLKVRELYVYGSLLKKEHRSRRKLNRITIMSADLGNKERESLFDLVAITNKWESKYYEVNQSFP